MESQQRSLSAFLKARFLQNISHSTFHAIPKIFRSANILSGSKYIFCFIISFLVCVYFVLTACTNYYEHPVITRIDNVHESSPQFPAIRVCSNQAIPENQEFLAECLYDGTSCPNTHLKREDSFCYSFNRRDTFQNTAPLTVNHVGAISGLTLLLSNNLENNYFNVFIYNQTMIKIDTSKSIKVTNDFESNLVVLRQFKTILPAPYNDCQDKVSLNGSTDYPFYQLDCLNLCQYREIAKMCNAAESFRAYADLYFLDMNIFQKENNVLLNNCKKAYSLTNIEGLKTLFFEKGGMLTCQGQCPTECNTVTYTVTPNYNILYEYLYKNMTKINIYYDSFEYTVISQIPKIKMEDFLAGVGGILGLFLGASILSFVEIVEMVIELMYGVHEYYSGSTKLKPLR